MMQIRSSCPLGHAKHFPDLAVRKAFHIVHYDHCSLPLGQRFQSRAEPPPQLIRFGGIVKGCRNGLVQLIGVPNLAPSAYVEGGICYYAPDPCSKGLIRSETGKRLVSVQEAFLHGVLRVLFRKRDCASYRKCANLMTTHERRKRIAAALLRFENERTLALNARTFRRRRVV